MEQRLIDANNLGVGKANPGIFVCKEYAHGWNNALQAVVEAAPTIDPETLPVVQKLRELVKDLEKQLSDWKFWYGPVREHEAEELRKNRAAVNVMRKRCEKTIAELRAELKQYKDLGVTPEQVALLMKFFKDRTSAEYIANDMKLVADSIQKNNLEKQLARVTAERDAAVECIYNIEDDLDRGNDNDWAREHISEWSSQQEDR